MSTNQNNKGFTLVEMSIVLVIIGLIVGGVLVGQDLVKSAQIRATVTQLEQYNAAMNTFRGKYNAMPGDISKAVIFGVGAAGQDGNGNGRLDDDATAIVTGNVEVGFAEELNWFWIHLSNANMVGGNYDADVTTGTSATNYEAGFNFPATKLKKGGILAVSDGSINYWVIGVEPSILGAATIIAGAGGAINPTEAYGMDSKLDDGFSNAGQMQMLTSVGLDTDGFGRVLGASAPSPTTCWATDPTIDDNPVDYFLANEGNICALTVRIQG